jgi:AhpD family alkylhydroperoxidase
MDERTKVLISLGASVAANCVPCFEHYLRQTDAVGLTPEEIQEAADIGDQVQGGARIAMRRGIRSMMGTDTPSCNKEPDRSCCG